MLNRKLKFGQIGGGQGSFIGAVHRRAAILDGKTELVAGAFSSTPERSIASGKELLIADDRNYGTWQEMLEGESKLPEGERIDFVNIVTPNHVHFEPALAFIEAGFHVIMDKPMVHTTEQAQALVAAVEKHDVVFALTHNYTGYPMVKEARDMVRNGRLGEIRRVVVEYPQGWLMDKLEDDETNKQAGWRTDPKRSGIAGAIGDIGTHCENLMSYITGLEIDTLCADVAIHVPGRLLDDDANVMLRFKNGARGLLWCSQISAGEENGLNIRVYGTKAGIYWRQEFPNWLYLDDPAYGPTQILKRGNDYLSAASLRGSHIPPGHPEAFFDAFGNIFMNATDTIRARLLGNTPTELELDFPNVYDGARGVQFIEKVIESGQSDVKWLPFD